MTSIAEYERWEAARAARERAAASVVLSSVAGVSPDETAKAAKTGLDFARETGRPQPPQAFTQEYRTFLEREIARSRQEKALAKAPGLAAWLQNPDNAALAHDDTESLSWIEGLGRGIASTHNRALARLAETVAVAGLEGALRRQSDADRDFGSLLSESMTETAADGRRYQRGLAGPSDVIEAGYRFLSSRLGGNAQAQAEGFAANITAAREYAARNPQSALSRDAQSRMFVDGATLAQSARNIAWETITNPLGVLSFALETAGESYPQMAAGVGVTAATRNPLLGVAVATGGGYLTERNISAADFLKDEGIDLSQPDAVTRLIADPTIMRKAAERGAIRALVVSAFDLASMGVAGRTLSQNPMVDALAQSVQQAVLGSAGEYSARRAAGQEIDWNDILAEGLAEMATTPVDIGIAGRRLQAMRSKARQAESDASTIADLAAGAQQSKLRQRMPESFRSFLDQALAGNGDADSLYVPAQAFDAYFQSLNVDPRSLLEKIEGVDAADYDIALASGGDVRIPVSAFASQIAGGGHDAFFVSNGRFSADAMTATEAAEFNEKAADLLAEAFEEAENQRLAEEEFRPDETRIYDEMVSRLRVAGRGTDVARTEAALYPAFYRTMAERSGLTVGEFEARFQMPQVAGEVPKGLQIRDVTEFNRRLALARSSRRIARDPRTSLLEWIDAYGGVNDTGGELRSRDAQSRPKNGFYRKRLKLARGTLAGVGDMFGSGGRKHGIDDVALAAYEAGYLDGHPDANAYTQALQDGTPVPDLTAALLERIDAELGGEYQFSGRDEAPENADDDGFDDYLRSLGVSLADDDAVILAAVNKAREASGETLAKERRGVIRMPKDGPGSGISVITLFARADLATFIHESGHFFLGIIQEMSRSGIEGDAAVAADYAVVKQWWRENAAGVARDGNHGLPSGLTESDVLAWVDNGTTGNAEKDRSAFIGGQEQWARAFEAYVMEGKAPSAELRSAFEKFRAWLIAIYRRLTALDVKPSDELRRVFDRMLASDEAIAEAQNDLTDMAATPEALGMSPQEHAAYVKLRQQSQDEAKARLLAETMAPIRRDRLREYRQERAALREKVAVQVNASPVYRAFEWIANRRWLGEGEPAQMPEIRMSRQDLVNRYGEGVLKTLPRGRFALYGDDGSDIDTVAALFGFSSGDQMVKALERAPRRQQAIADVADKIMRERHGDVLNDGTMEQRAIEAVHSGKRAQVLATELQAMTAIAGTDRGLSVKEAREIARLTLSRMKVRDAMASQRYLAAERRAGREAMQLLPMVSREKLWADRARMRASSTLLKAGAADASRSLGAVSTAIDASNESAQRFNKDAARLVEMKRRQLLNHALYEESRIIADEVAKAEKLAARLQKKTVRSRLAADHLPAIDDLLEQYDFRRLTAGQENRRGALVAYVERMRAEGREGELSIPDEVLRNAARLPYKTIPVEMLRGVVESLRNLEHKARRWQKLADARSERELSEVVGEIAASFDANVAKRPPGRFRTAAEGVLSAGRQYLDLVLNASTLLREIDGFEDGGAAYRHIKAPIDAAMNALQGRRKKAAIDLESLYAVYSKAERRAMAKREFFPAIGQSLSKWERIAIALNTGNADNMQRLTDPRVKGHFKPQQVQAVLDSLSDRDAKFVQSVWDYLDGFRPDLEAREKRRTGVSPKWVEASPVTIGGRQLRGGYYPIKYDPRLSDLARDDEANDVTAAIASGRFGKAQTRNGHLKERARSSGRGVDLDISVLHRHVNQVVYDLELSEPVANAWRILQDGRIRAKFRESGKQADFDALENWLKDVGEGEVRSADLLGRVARTAKTNFTFAKLAFNLSTAMVQITGVSQSMVVVGKANFLAGARDSLRRGAIAEVTAKSNFMADRQTTFNKDIYDLYEDPKNGPVASRWAEARNFMAPLGFWLMTKIQFHLVDMPTWLAGYRQGLSRFGNDEAMAVAHADAVVKRAQASGLFSDRSAVERGTLSRTQRQSDVVRLFTTLGSYMFAKFNVAYERGGKAGRVFREQGVSRASAIEAGSLLVDMLFLFTVEAMLYAAIKGRLPDDDDEDDESLATFAVRETFAAVLSTLPIVRDVQGAATGFEGGGAYGAITAEAGKMFAQIGDLEADKAMVKSMINGAALAVGGIPAGQINRLVDARWRQLEGEGVSVLEYMIGRSGK